MIDWYVGNESLGNGGFIAMQFTASVGGLCHLNIAVISKCVDIWAVEYNKKALRVFKVGIASKTEVTKV